MAQSGIDLRNNNLQDLQVQSVKLLAGLLSVVAYGWLMWIIWPESEAARPATWTAGLVWLAGAGLAYLLHRRWLAASSWLLVGCTLVGVAAAVVAGRTPEIVYFLALPVIMASLLLSPAGLAIATAVAIGLGLGTAALLGTSLASAGFWLPLALILLVALAYWFGARSLYLALQWMWTGYEDADRNERLATERQAELRQVLKSLDEALFSLERANQMLAQARDEAVEARRMKQQFAQTISHELRTPLNLIVGFTELMTQSPEYYGAPPAPAYLRDLAIVYRNARHLQDLVTDVLDLARIEAAEMTIVPEDVEPGEMVNEAVHTARGLVEARGLALSVDVQPGLPRLWVDATRIRQVLINLLNNAVRFTERGGIALSVRRSGKDVEFAVRDTGVGIPPEHLERIFDEFRQVDGSTRRPHGGVGLGLAISRRFVELHHGRIWAESEVGKGSVFYFSLPAERSGELEPSRDLLRLASPAPLETRDRILLVVTRSPAAAGLLTRYLKGVRTVVFPDLDAVRAAASAAAASRNHCGHQCRLRLPLTVCKSWRGRWGCRGCGCWPAPCREKPQPRGSCKSMVIWPSRSRGQTCGIRCGRLATTSIACWW